MDAQFKQKFYSLLEENIPNVANIILMVVNAFDFIAENNKNS